MNSTKMNSTKPKFIQVTVQEKGYFDNDFRAFLACELESMRYTIRGYGKTVGEAADDAYAKMTDENWDMFVDEEWEVNSTK